MGSQDLPQVNITGFWDVPEEERELPLVISNVMTGKK
jgi:hypothetical protein